MANYYLMFSEVLEQLSPDEEAWLRSQLESVSVAPLLGTDSNEVQDDDELSVPRFLEDYDEYDGDAASLGIECAFHDDGPDRWGRYLWVYAEEGGDPGVVAWLVRKFLREFRPSQCWSLSYATTCSKSRVGDFGGGAVFVTAADINWQSSHDFVNACRQAFLGQDKREPEQPAAASTRAVK